MHSQLTEALYELGPLLLWFGSIGVALILLS
jgi:hypothetical protein